jgi:hypothetical protein
MRTAGILSHRTSKIKCYDRLSPGSTSAGSPQKRMVDSPSARIWSRTSVLLASTLNESLAGLSEQRPGGQRPGQRAVDQYAGDGVGTISRPAVKAAPSRIQYGSTDTLSQNTICQTTVTSSTVRRPRRSII